MGFIQRLIKSLLGFLLILSLSSFIMLNSLYHATQEDFIMGQFKTMMSSQNEFNSSMFEMHSAMIGYFYTTNATQTSVVIQNKNLTFTREDSELSDKEFNSLVLDKILEGMYDTSLKEMGFNYDLSLRQVNEKLYSWQRLSIILSILIIVAAFALLTGRLVFLGVNMIIVGITYYPMKYSVDKTISLSLSKLQGPEAAVMQPFITNIMGKIMAVSATWYLYAFIAGAVCVAAGILLKVLGIGMWFQSWFEKKKK